ncbi:hypothetical protein ACA910_015180 [Epithemia clementina (nom. ined.)]
MVRSNSHGSTDPLPFRGTSAVAASATNFEKHKNEEATTRRRLPDKYYKYKYYSSMLSKDSKSMDSQSMKNKLSSSYYYYSASKNNNNPKYDSYYQKPSAPSKNYDNDNDDTVVQPSPPPPPPSSSAPVLPPKPAYHHDCVPCFANQAQAAAIGYMVFSSLLTSVVHEAQCRPAQLKSVLEQYFRSDVILQYSNGTIAAQGLDQVPNYFIFGTLQDDNGNHDTTSLLGPFRLACSHILSWTVQKVVTQANVQDEFVLGVYQNFYKVDDKGDSSPSSSSDNKDDSAFFKDQTTNGSSLYVAMELFSGGYYSNFWKHMRGGASPAYGQSSLASQCQRPQIYAIVIEPTSFQS